jgi:hypothetical protein
MASQLGADLFLLHAPSGYNFREPDRLFAYLSDSDSDSDSLNVTSVYETHLIGFRVPDHSREAPFRRAVARRCHRAAADDRG